MGNLRVFEESDLRRRYLAEVVDVEADATWQKLTGLELWFAPPRGTVVPQPTRWRMALVMIAVVYSLVASIGRLIAMVLGDVPAPFASSSPSPSRSSSWPTC